MQEREREREALHLDFKAWPMVGMPVRNLDRLRARGLAVIDLNHTEGLWLALTAGGVDTDHFEDWEDKQSKGGALVR